MRIIAAVVLMLLGAAASVAFASSSTSPVRWAKVGSGGKESTQLALVRSGDVLHVVSAQGAPAALVDTELNGSGGVQKTSTVATNVESAGGLAAVGMADGSVRLFFTGGVRPGLPSNLSGVNSFVKAAGSDAWALDPAALWGGAVAGAAAEIGGALLGNDQPVTAWSGGFVHVGVRPSAAPDPSYQPDCCGIAPQLATDAATGAVVMSWLSNGRESGTYVKQVLPSQGPTVSLPSGLTEGSSGIAARIGAPGTFVAFTDPNKGQVELYEYGATTSVVHKGAYRVAKVFAAPEGRLWMLWGDANSGVFVTRSNKAVTRWEPVHSIPLPPNLTAFYNAQGEGSAGPLDAFVDLLVGTGDRGFWRAHILPQLSLAASVSYQSGGRAKKEHVSFRMTDAGDPVTGVITLIDRSGKPVAHVRTSITGNGSVTLNGGVRLRATGSAPGYDNAIITVG